MGRNRRRQDWTQHLLAALELRASLHKPGRSAPPDCCVQETALDSTPLGERFDILLFPTRWCNDRDEYYSCFRDSSQQTGLTESQQSIEVVWARVFQRVGLLRDSTLQEASMPNTKNDPGHDPMVARLYVCGAQRSQWQTISLVGIV